MVSTAVELEVRQLSGTIGAEIRGLDLSEPLDADTVAAVRAAWLRHKVVFFPGANLSAEQHVAFARQFGEPTPAHPLVPGVDGYPEIFEIDYGAAAMRPGDGDRRAFRVERGVPWHTDVTFVERPPMGSILNAVEIPPAGGDTMWCDQQAAYEGLSDRMRSFLDGLTASHASGRAFKAYGELPPVVHPVVRAHPETGRRGLFVNPQFTTHIVELDVEEGDALLAFLYRHATKPEYVVRYHWEAGDLGWWDNRATQHSVVGDFGNQARVIQRVTLEGDRPY